MAGRCSVFGALLVVTVAVSFPHGADATPQQWTPDDPGSDNIEVVAHLPLGPRLSVADIEIEQELHRPFVYIARMVYGSEGEKGTDIISIEDPANPKVIYRWRIEHQDLHQGSGGMDVKYFKWKGRYYLVQSVQFNQGGPNSAMGAVILDVTGLPDPATVREVARIQAPDQPTGFHNIFIYTHASGRVMLFATTEGAAVNVYDLGDVVDDRQDEALIATVPVPVGSGMNPMASYHDMYVAFHADSQQDRFYGAGTGGYYVYNVSDIANPELLVALVDIEGVKDGHTFTATPDGRYVVAETEYRHAPLRIFDLQPALDGEVSTIQVPISVWTADWNHLVHNHEIRWPYVFVSGYMDGLQVFSLMDPHNPATVAYYDTYVGPLNTDVYPTDNGAFGVDVRNADGLIVISDMTTGFWAFRMDGFRGWNGADWGLPDISSVQQWPDGATAAPAQRPRRILYEAVIDGQSEIMLINEDGSGSMRLTNHRGYDGMPSWTAAGDILFVSDRAGEGQGDVYRMAADGSGLQRITTDGAGYSFPKLSPDGQWIGFDGGRGGDVAQVWVMRADGSDVRQVSPSDVDEGYVSWTADSRALVYDSFRDGSPEIYRGEIATGEVTRLTFLEDHIGDPQMSPDGTLLTFESGRDGNSEIYVTNADGSDPRRLTNNPADDRASAISHDNTRVVFASDRDGDREAFELWIMNIDGSNLRKLTATGTSNLYPSFEPR